MGPQSDPRVFFAAERTMLAWLRTGIASIGLGFLIARFGYFMALLHGEHFHASLPSTLLGTGLVLVGTAMIGASTWQHARFIATLDSAELPRQYSVKLGLVMSTMMAVAGIVLATYLALSDTQREPTSPASPQPQRQPSAAIEQETLPTSRDFTTRRTGRWT